MRTTTTTTTTTTTACARRSGCYFFWIGIFLGLRVTLVRGFVQPGIARCLRCGRAPKYEGGSARSVSSLSLPPVEEYKVAAAMKSDNIMRGKLMVIISKFSVPREKYAYVLEAILDHTYWPEVALIAAMTSSLPVARFLYSRLPRNRGLDDDAVADAYRKSKIRKVAFAVQKVGLLQAALYLSDVALVALTHLDFEFVARHQAQKVTGSVIFSTWMAINLSRLKYFYLRAGRPLSPSNIRARRKAKAGTGVTTGGGIGVTGDSGDSSMGFYSKTLNRLLDVIIYLCGSLVVMDILGIQLGFTLKSIFGIGSFGTLVLSLASKDVAAGLVGGIMIQTSDFFDEDDTVVLQDGTTGKVVKIGWLHTFILKEDDFLVRVPNSQISNQRIARVKRGVAQGQKDF